LETDEELMDHIYSGSRLCPGHDSGDQATAFEDLYHASQDTSSYCFRGLILRLTRHFIRDLYYAHTTLQYSNPPL